MDNKKRNSVGRGDLDAPWFAQNKRMFDALRRRVGSPRPTIERPAVPVGAIINRPPGFRAIDNRPY